MIICYCSLPSFLLFEIVAMHFFLCFISLFWPLLLQAETKTSQPFYVWVELGPNSTLIARSIVAKNQPCPSIHIDEHTYPMQTRAKATEEFPVNSCEYILPKKAQKVLVNGQSLPLLPQRLERIVIIGDTGCRVKGLAIQACNDRGGWPFPAIAQHIADLKPDLVIHVGDYHYRESSCPLWKKGCKNSPFGYGWQSWESDFFKPAKPLLAKVPWIMVRGNHEGCKRAGAGWLRFLDPYPFSTECTNYTPPYAVNVGDQQFVVFDSADAALTVKKKQQEKYRAQFQAVATLTKGSQSTWLLLHHPIWSFYQMRVGPLIANTRSLQVASEGMLSPAIKLIVSGHLHLVGWLHFKPVDGKQQHPRSPQLIAGNSGSLLIKHFINFHTFEGKLLEGQTITQGFSRNGFGYLLATRQGDQWVISDRRMDGVAVNQFSIAAAK